MVKAKLSIREGKDALFIGLSDKNIQLLKENKPIEFDASEIGFPGLIVGIVYGETEEKIAEQYLYKNKEG